MKVRHILGISGGKDSTALAIYLKSKYPELDVEYFFCDTDKELPETYEYLEKLKIFLGRPFKILPERKRDIHLFDRILMVNRGFLPSVRQRWCTVQMKLRPIEEFVGSDKVISYVGIRGDEERSAYISKQPNIQSIFPFKKNMWSDDVVLQFLANRSIGEICEMFHELSRGKAAEDYYGILKKEVTSSFDVDDKINALLDIDAKLTNKLIFRFLKTTEYPLAYVDNFPLIENNEVLGLEEIISILEENGIGLPAYYKKIEFEVDGKTGSMNRSRSGCYFCFFQQRIEWLWLYEQHPELFQKAMDYEKEGYTWIEGEPLSELIKPERIRDIKLKQIEKNEKQANMASPFLIDSLDLEENEACTVCMLNLSRF